MESLEEDTELDWVQFDVFNSVPVRWIYRFCFNVVIILKNVFYIFVIIV